KFVVLKYLTNLNMEFGNGTKYKITAASIALSIGGLDGFDWTEVQSQTSVLRFIFHPLPVFL
ncbi:MAG TPA: hypothetical protein VHQ04_07345, partial [Puia sp.]|nr:hypothetical protein [Puia sp.]